MISRYLILAVLLFALVLASASTIRFCCRGGMDCDNCSAADDNAGTVLFNQQGASVEDEEEEVLQEFYLDDETGVTSVANAAAKPIALTKEAPLFTKKQALFPVNGLGEVRNPAYDCQSNCHNIMAGFSCGRCLRPYALYNKTITPHNMCFETTFQISKLTSALRLNARTACEEGGKCVCTPFEMFESFMDSACTYKCSSLGLRTDESIHVYNPRIGARCPLVPMLTKHEKRIYTAHCLTGRFTMRWLLKRYNVQQVYKYVTGLDATTLLGPNGTIAEPLIKAIGRGKPNFVTEAYVITTRNKTIQEFLLCTIEEYLSLQ